MNRNKRITKKLSFLSAGYCLFVFFWQSPLAAQQNAVVLQSPDKSIEVQVTVQDTAAVYTIYHAKEQVILPSRLGLETTAGNFTSRLKLTSVSPIKTVNDRYQLFTGKKTNVTYRANGRNLQLTGLGGQKLEIIFQVSNDGVAFRYRLPARGSDSLLVTRELTSFSFDTAARAFLQPMQVAKTGFEKTNPAYEDNYQQNIPVGTASPSGAGWVYPALFQSKNKWLLLTEAAMDGRYCATRLVNEKNSPEYRVGFPDPRETMDGEDVRPKGAGEFYSPWRVIAIGGLSTIIESTLGTDLAPPALATDFSFVQPGKSSWSWIMSKDDSIVYSEQKRYIDFAADMNWQYCLVDAAWDQKIGYEKMAELSAYAATKNVGMLLWYNSAGDWNTVKYTPKDKMLTHESRMAEFGRLKAMGIKGVKIDFFGGDGRAVIQYYLDILKDAAEAGMLVNFHGATLPRGWSRTFPNLVTVEAVKGFEMITFNQRDADREANHCTLLPFTRNAFDPMDFTPMNLYRIPTNVKRKTTTAFELATSVLFLSGIQHFAESPAGMSRMPGEVKDFLRQLPVRWEEVKFIEGFPGKYVVLARKWGNRWYIAGINGEAQERSLTLDLSKFGKKTVRLITDKADADELLTETGTYKAQSLTLKPAGGFVMVLE